MGSAKGVRWRGELDTVPRHGSADHTHEPAGHPEEHDERLEIDRGDVTQVAPPWLISTIIHLILLLILALISTPVGDGLSKIALEIGESIDGETVALEEFPVAMDDPLAESTDQVEESQVDLDLPTLFEPVEPLELTPLEFGAGPAATESKPMFGGRSGAMKKALMAKYGATPETEDAVALGLAWLKRNQESKGSWSMKGPYGDPSLAENRVAATAMALLAFLGDGNTHLSGEYSEEVEAGLKFLVQRQQGDGRFNEPGGRDDEIAYAQAQATIALCEAYAMTKDSWLRAPAQAALDFAAAAQSREGGWRYRPRFDSDTSVTGWYVMALQSGISAGLDVEPATLQNVSYFLDSVQGFEGAAYAYKPGRPMSDAMTAEGLLCRQYLGWPRSRIPMIRGVEALVYEDNLFDPDNPNVYYWYYATQVLHHYGGSPWMKWNDAMRHELPKMQVRRGREAGSWSPQQDKWGKSAGRLYTTCLSIYCLEVYYRHLPLYSFGNDWIDTE